MMQSVLRLYNVNDRMISECRAVGGMRIGYTWALPCYHIVHHKSHIAWHGIRCGSPWWEAGDCLSCSTCSIMLKSGPVQMQIYYKAVDVHNVHWYKYSSCAPSTAVQCELGVSVNRWYFQEYQSWPLPDLQCQKLCLELEDWVLEISVLRHLDHLCKTNIQDRCH
jgi:hypothetical protein